MRISTLALSLVLATAAVSSITSCSHDTSTRTGRLLTMAAEEAGFIDSLQDRLTRQLNIADLQIQTGQKTEALKTLDLAATTLRVDEKEKKTLDDFRRIAGWTSVAELSHQAGGDKPALDAYYNAVESLNSVQPVTTRAQYVLSLSEICLILKGKDEAGQLLIKGGEWASKIPDTLTRRYALTTFTTQLIGYDNLDAARTVMRNEPDATWRADSLAAMARQAMVIEQKQKGSESRYATAAESPSVRRSQLSADSVSDQYSGFNKRVQYKDNFRQADLQQGFLPNGTSPRP